MHHIRIACLKILDACDRSRGFFHSSSFHYSWVLLLAVIIRDGDDNSRDGGGGVYRRDRRRKNALILRVLVLRSIRHSSRPVGFLRVHTESGPRANDRRPSKPLDHARLFGLYRRTRPRVSYDCRL